MSLTTEERLLLREVFGWAHANKWRRSHEGDEAPKWQRLRSWEWIAPAGGQVFAERVRHDQNPDDWRVVGNLPLLGIGVELGRDGDLSLSSAVDVLAAIGVLPSRFSSAFAAGRESAYDRDEWRVCSGPANKHLPEEYQFPYVFAEEIGSAEDAELELRRAQRMWASEESWLESRRNGSSPWVRVPEAGDGDA